LNRNQDEGGANPEPMSTDMHRENVRDALQDFWQATLDLHSCLLRAEEHQQHDVTVPTETLKTLLDSVETIKTAQNLQERHSVASLYFGTILGALIGIIGSFFVSFWFSVHDSWNAVGLAISSFLLLLVCVTLFMQARKYTG